MGKRFTGVSAFVLSFCNGKNLKKRCLFAKVADAKKPLILQRESTVH
jgi:hypothetical protein